jgi:hypothetical protein
MDDYYPIKPISASMLHPLSSISSPTPLLLYSTISISPPLSIFNRLLSIHHSIIHAFLTSIHSNSQKTMNLHLHSYKHEYLDYVYQ